MLAAHHDQENVALSRQAGASSKVQNQNPMGARFHKTPLKVPLNDENAPTRAGKSVLGAKNGKNLLQTVTKGKGVPATPLEPRTGRAPLGNKTTNAKARTGQVQGVKSIVREFEKSQPPATISRPPKQTLTNRTESGKLDVHTDASKGPFEEDDIEYAPPRVEIPYESEDFQDGILNYESLKPHNRLRNYYSYYHNPEPTARLASIAPSRSSKNLEAQQQDITDEWAVGDVPTTTKYLDRGTGNGPSSTKERGGQGVKRVAGQGVNRAVGHGMHRGAGPGVSRGVGQGVNRGAGQGVNRGVGQRLGGGVRQAQNQVIR